MNMFGFLWSLVRLVFRVAILLLALGFILNWWTGRSLRHAEFLKGSVPNPALDGFYKGSASFYTGSWRGKKFDATNLSGINVFGSNDTTKERFPFKTSTGRSVGDSELTVLKIDYDIQQNPFWLRPILDELVQVSPGRYLGTMNLRLIPGFPFRVVYFELNK